MTSSQLFSPLPSSVLDKIASITSAATAEINGVAAADASEITVATNVPLVPSINSAASASETEIAAAAIIAVSVVSQDALGTSTTTPTNSVTDTVAHSKTSKSASSKASSMGSAATGNDNASTTSTPLPPSTTTSPPPNRLPNGTVAGIVVGAAIGLAFLTFLATFLILRRKYSNRLQRRLKGPPIPSVIESASRQDRKGDVEPKLPFVRESSSTSASVDNYHPQSADDQTIRTRVQTTLDQIELHVENFYHDAPVPNARHNDTGLVFFASTYLPNTLGTMLAQSRNSKVLIKHALAQFIISKISHVEKSEGSLLPDEFLLTPKTTGLSGPGKPGFGKQLSRWRILTAHVRVTPTEDAMYIKQRDEKIEGIVRAASQAFAPWKKPSYPDLDRAQSLTAILKEAADLGIWIFSQPCDLRFSWPRSSELGANRVAVTPALVKTSDEMGQSLPKAQVLVDATIHGS